MNDSLISHIYDAPARGELLCDQGTMGMSSGGQWRVAGFGGEVAAACFWLIRLTAVASHYRNLPPCTACLGILCTRQLAFVLEHHI